MAMKAGGEGIKRVARGAKKSPTRRVTAKSTFDLDDAAAEPATTSPIRTAFAPGGVMSLGTSVKPKDVTDFLRQLIMLLEAGTPLLKSLHILSERGERAGIRAMVADIASYVESGNALWQGFERHSRHFDPVFISLIKASEASGTLNIVLKRLVTYRERRDLLGKRVRGAMWYPAVLVIVCVLVLFLISKVVVPEFKGLFERLDVDIPTYTKMFFTVTETVTSLWFGIGIVVAIAALIMVYKFWVALPLGRLKADRWKFMIPRIGKSILRKFAVVEFTRSLSLLLRSGLSMMVTLDLVRGAIHNKAFAHMLQGVRDSVERGEGIEQPLRRAGSLIPSVVVDMLVTGEESGQLDQIAEHIADTYEEEVNITISTIGDMLQPILTIVIGIFVMGLFAALFVPMISALESLQSAGSGGM